MIININKSYYLGIFIIIIYAFGAGILFTLNTPLWLLAPLAFPVVIIGWAQARKYAFLSSETSIVAVEIKDGLIEIAFAAEPARFLKSKLLKNFVSQNLIIIKLRVQGQKSTNRLLLVRGMCTGRDFRLVKKFLRLSVGDQNQQLVV